MQKLYLSLILLSGFAPILAQTKLDLRSQSRNVDFGSALSTRPIKTGDTLPGNCQIGELFFRTSIAAGKNLFGCTAPDIWTSQSISLSPSGVPSYTVTFTAQTSITITAVMHGFTSPDMLVTCYNSANPAVLVQPASVSIGSISLDVVITFASLQSGRCILNGPGTPYVSGEGIIQNGTEFSVDTAAVPTFLTTQVTLPIWVVSAQSCADRFLPLVGAGALNAVAPGWPVDLPASLSGSMFVSSAGTVTVRVCNVSNAAVTIPARSFGAAILKGF